MNREKDSSKHHHRHHHHHRDDELTLQNQKRFAYARMRKRIARVLFRVLCLITVLTVAFCAYIYLAE
ncbi:MAG: hypothetical protein ACTTK2_08330 [Hoylesella marshii]|uniref:hypothetical protein n=1 Tax=Hoylesella marshii TaxID=189722 RepID=UPI003FA15D9D